MSYIIISLPTTTTAREQGCEAAIPLVFHLACIRFTEETIRMPGLRRSVSAGDSRNWHWVSESNGLLPTSDCRIPLLGLVSPPSVFSRLFSYLSLLFFLPPLLFCCFCLLLSARFDGFHLAS